jgi:tryptophan-rich sensory protein
LYKSLLALKKSMTASTKSILPLSLRVLKPSHRPAVERWAGLGILLALALGFQSLGGWIANFSVHGEWFQSRMNAPWAFSTWPISSLWTFFYCAEFIAFWVLWRRNSLLNLKLELSLFLSQFALSTLWFLSLFIWQQSLLSLVVLLLQNSATLLCAIVFWRKERLSGQWMIIGLAWGIYIASLNMAFCLLN